MVSKRTDNILDWLFEHEESIPCEEMLEKAFRIVSKHIRFREFLPRDI